MEAFAAFLPTPRRRRRRTETNANHHLHPPSRSSRLLFAQLVLLLALSSIMTHSTANTAMAGGDSCGSQLLALSPCLPYMAAPPNNASSKAGPQCCDAFLAAAGGGYGCLCRLLREPSLLGFPINPTRLLSLPSLCGGGPSNLTSARSLHRVCRGGGGASPAVSPAPSPTSLSETHPPSASYRQRNITAMTPTSFSSSSSSGHSLPSPPPPAVAAYLLLAAAIALFFTFAA